MADPAKVAMLVELGASAEQAAFFLDAAGGNAEAAAAAFLEGGGGAPSSTGDAAPAPVAAAPAPAVAAAAPAPAAVAARPPSAAAPPARPSQRRTGGFATFSSLGGGGGGGDDGGDDDDPRKPQELFTGGEKSGMAVLGPSPSGGDGPPRVEFAAYKDGFTINNGPLRKYDEPENAQIVREIGEGRVPRALATEFGEGGDIEMAVIDKRQEEYAAQPRPKPELVPFSGAGQRLGSSPSAGAAAAGSDSGAAGSAGGDDAAAAAAAASAAAASAVSVDESKPKTQVMIRLADGSQHRATLNQDHTAADLRKTIEALGKGGFEYKLMTTPPPMAIADETQTLQAAGLCNAVVLQRRV